MAKILGVGGGSGGHVTPVVAVFRELREIDPLHQFVFWCDNKFRPSAVGIFAKYDQSIPVEKIVAGKFRRYHGLGKWHHFRPSIFWPNVWDALKVGIGFIQSFFKLLKLRPDVIFMKGGFVCLPVGYAARLLKIPMVLHDSDAHPGLTNRLLAPFATKIGTGAPLEYYNYPPEKAEYVGIPVGADFRPYSMSERAALKEGLGFEADRPLLVVTGGGLGAVRINNAVVEVRSELLKLASVFLISGHHQYDELKQQVDERAGWRLEPFVSERMAEVLAAADIVVTRAGATTLAELSALHKPTIIIPNANLTAGHQIKNAKVYQDNLAAVVIDETELGKSGQVLVKKVEQILRAPKILKGLGDNFAKFAKPEAARDMAEMIMLVLRRQGRRG